MPQLASALEIQLSMQEAESVLYELEGHCFTFNDTVDGKYFRSKGPRWGGQKMSILAGSRHPAHKKINWRIASFGSAPLEAV